jgi:hypothetical protein
MHDACACTFVCTLYISAVYGSSLWSLYLSLESNESAYAFHFLVINASNAYVVINACQRLSDVFCTTMQCNIMGCPGCWSKSSTCIQSFSLPLLLQMISF